MLYLDMYILFLKYGSIALSETTAMYVKYISELRFVLGRVYACGV
jgi:hypothetical protein